jgi:oleate hydratase
LSTFNQQLETTSKTQSSIKMQTRDPNNTQAWLVGSGISSLAAALHLIKDAKVPGPSIHIIDTHNGSGGGMRMEGSEESGNFLPFECTPHFHGSCVERLLSLIPSVNDPEKSTLETVHGRDVEKRSATQLKHEEHHEASHHLPASILDRLFSPSAKDHASLARFVAGGASGPDVSHHAGVHLGLNQRMVLIGFMLEHESAVLNKSIKDIFNAEFFETEFWMLWSTT